MRREIPRSPRTLSKLEQRSPPSPKPTIWERVLKSGPFVVAFSGLLVSLTAMLIALTTNGPALLKNMSALAEWYRTDQDLSGRWNNSSEGDMEPSTWSTSEGDAVFLEMTAYQGNVSGVVVSQRLCKYSPHTDVFVEGKLAGSKGILMFWDYIRGEKRAFAKAKFRIDRARRLLDIEVTEQAPDLFPTAFRLGKAADSTTGDDGSTETHNARDKEALKSAGEAEHALYQGSFCEEFLRAVRESGEHKTR